MAKSYKIAGQIASAINQSLELYAVPVGKSFISSNFMVVNRSATDAYTFRVAVVKNGETLSDKHYIIYDEILNARESRKLPVSFTITEGDKVMVQSNSNALSFSLFGSEF